MALRWAWLIAAILLVVFCKIANPPAIAFWHGSAVSSCTTNGSDGFAGAPSGSAEYPTLLSGYGANIPSWCVAGIGYAVGITPNATVSGNTITETGVTQAPTNGDKKTFYPRMGSGWPSGSLPSGITAGTAYFVCSESGSATTYSYEVSSSSGCSPIISLGSLSASFIALKVPQATTSTPSNTTGWTGSATPCGQGLTFLVCNSAAVTLDHWDFSSNGGDGPWGIYLGSFAITITNDYFVIGAGNQSILGNTNTPDDVTISNNVVDGNAIAVYTTTTATASSGASAIVVSSTAGLTANMTVGDLTTSSMQSGTLISSVVGSTVNLSKTLSGNVGNGDNIGFVNSPGAGSSIYNEPQITFVDAGTTVAEYNWIKNTCSEHWQQSLPSGAVTSGGITFKYNLLENTGWCGPINGNHGDVQQLYSGNSSGTFGTITQEYNTVIQNNANAQASSTTLSDLISGTFGASAGTVNIENNTALYPVSGNQVTSTVGLAAVNVTWFATAVNIENNYVDPTSACDGSCGASFWAEVSTNPGGGTGPNSPPCTSTGNINLTTGAALPKPLGSYC